MGRRSAQVDLEARVNEQAERIAELERKVAHLQRQRRSLREELQPRRATAKRKVSGMDRLALRREAAFATKTPAASVLEIGPAHNAILPKREGFDTRTVDYLDREGLIHRYREFERYSPDDIEEVDYVLAPGVEMADHIDDTFDVVLASHVLEHTTSLVDFLNQCTRLLAPGGHVSLVVPDHRYCFDRFRERSSLARVIDASLDPPAVHTVGTITEDKIAAVKHGGATAWLPGHEGDYRSVWDAEYARRSGEQAAKKERYIDVHNWVFTPNHCRLLLADLHALGYLSLRESWFRDTVRHEFYLNLSVDGPGPSESREELVVLADRERLALDVAAFEAPTQED